MNNGLRGAMQELLEIWKYDIKHKATIRQIHHSRGNISKVKELDAETAIIEKHIIEVNKILGDR